MGVLGPPKWKGLKNTAAVNFMCLFVSATGCPDIWLNIILGCICGVFLEEISMWVRELSKAVGLPQCGWTSPSLLKACIEQKRQRKVEIPLPDYWAGTLIFSCPRHSWFSGFRTQTGTYTISSLALRPLNYTTGFPVSPACGWQIMGLLSLHN